MGCSQLLLGLPLPSCSATRQLPLLFNSPAHSTHSLAAAPATLAAAASGALQQELAAAAAAAARQCAQFRCAKHGASHDISSSPQGTWQGDWGQTSKAVFWQQIMDAIQTVWSRQASQVCVQHSLLQTIRQQQPQQLLCHGNSTVVQAHRSYGNFPAGGLLELCCTVHLQAVLSSHVITELRFAVQRP